MKIKSKTRKIVIYREEERKRGNDRGTEREGENETERESVCVYVGVFV